MAFTKIPAESELTIKNQDTVKEIGELEKFIKDLEENRRLLLEEFFKIRK